jgi:hypothetical protein
LLAGVDPPNFLDRGRIALGSSGSKIGAEGSEQAARVRDRHGILRCRR